MDLIIQSFIHVDRHFYQFLCTIVGDITVNYMWHASLRLNYDVFQNNFFFYILVHISLDTLNNGIHTLFDRQL